MIGRYRMIAHRAYVIKFELLKIFNRPDEALDMIDSFIDEQKNSPSDKAHVTRGYILKSKSEYLLALGRQKEARLFFENAIKSTQYIDNISFNEHAEIIMHDAIMSGDDDYALSLFDSYVPLIKVDDDWNDWVSFNLRAYKIYIGGAW